MIIIIHSIRVWSHNVVVEVNTSMTSDIWIVLYYRWRFCWPLWVSRLKSFEYCFTFFNEKYHIIKLKFDYKRYWNPLSRSKQKTKMYKQIWRGWTQQKPKEDKNASKTKGKEKKRVEQDKRTKKIQQKYFKTKKNYVTKQILNSKTKWRVQGSICRNHKETL